MQLHIEYTNKLLTKIEQDSYIENKWYDLRASESVKLREGQFATIPLGIKVALPEDYEMNIIARKSTFKKYGIFLAGGMEIVSSNDSDEISINVYATKDVTINFNDRICQFRLQRAQEQITFV